MRVSGTLHPHYQLHNEPGSMVILVRDLEQEATPELPVRSAGESFVVSLALAPRPFDFQ